MKLKSSLIVLALLALVVAGCGNSAPPVTPPVQPTQGGGAYPSGSGAASASTPAGGAYPPAPQKTACAFAPLAFDPREVAAGTTTLTGTGPADMPILIASVFQMGRSLGSGKVGADGRFSITVPPVSSKDQLGIAINDLTGTPYTVEQVQKDPCFQGPESMQVPQVGFFYDTIIVK